MSLVDVDRIRRLISKAASRGRRRDVEVDKGGAYSVTSLTRPGFSELVKVAHQQPSALIAVFSSLESSTERLLTSEALSQVCSPLMAGFWEGIIEGQSDQELLGCAAIGIARQGELTLLERIEKAHRAAATPRLMYHLGVARLLLNDPRGVDHLIEVLRSERVGNSAALREAHSHGPTMSFIALNLLKGLFRKGPGDDSSQWIEWWRERRARYKHIDSSVLEPYELSYIPPLCLFTDDQHSAG